MPNTDQDIVLDSTNNSNFFRQFNLGSDWKVGDVITLSGDFIIVPNLDTIEIDIYSADFRSNRSGSVNIPTGKGVVAHIPIKNMAGSGDNILCVYAGHLGGTHGEVLTLHHFMVNRGSETAPWTSATTIE